MDAVSNDDPPRICVVEVGGLHVGALINLVINDALPERAVLCTDPRTGNPIAVWTENE